MRRQLPFVSALVVLCVGLFTVVSRANVPAFALGAAAAGSSNRPHCACHAHRAP
ncbi:MAG: hypothetical protein QM756_44410 [Polyangiaceae bacterium]